MTENKKLRIVVGLGNYADTEQVISLLQRTYDVASVSDSEEAYHTIHSFKPDMAVLDFSLPKINPIDLYEGVALAHPRVTFILCVTAENYEVAQRIWKKRAVDFIFKPFFPLQFINNLNTIIRNLLNVRALHACHERIKKLEATVADLKAQR